MKRIYLKIDLTLILLFAAYSCSAGGLPWKQSGSDFSTGVLDGTSASPEGVTLSKNLVKNSSFENNSGWTVPSGGVWDSTVKHSGLYSGKTENSQQQDWNNWEQIIDVIPGHSYSASCWIKTGQLANGAGVAFFFHHLDSGNTIISQSWGPYIYASNQDWTRYTISFAVASNIVRVRLGCSVYQPSGKGSTAWFDDVYLEDITQNVYVSEGTFESTIFDCGNKTTYGRIFWKADIPSGCTITFNTRTSPDGSTWSAWSDTYTTSGSLIKSLPQRYIQYRANFYTTDSSRTPLLKEVSITSPLAGITVRPSYNIKNGDALSFAINFNETMDQTSKCTITIVPEVGTNTQSISTGTWSGNTFISNPVNFVSLVNGFASVQIRGAKIQGGNEVFATMPGILLIDNDSIGPGDKIEFFPNPFSPNGDGRAEEARLMFTISQPANLTARIYNLKGTLVRTLVENEEKYGNVSLTWDGKDEKGEMCPVGLYIFQVKTGNTVKTGTVVLTK